MPGTFILRDFLPGIFRGWNLRNKLENTGKKGWKNMKRVLLLLLFLLFTLTIISGQAGEFFLYIPEEEEMREYLNLYDYLSGWAEGKNEINDERLQILFRNYVGQDTLSGLLCEAFFRSLKQRDLQEMVISHLDKYGPQSSFTESLKKLYSAEAVYRKQDDKEVIQYNYLNQEFDENINLFSLREITVFNRELGLLLTDNDWDIINMKSGAEDDEGFFLIFGGGTNSMYMQFYRHTGVVPENLADLFKREFFEKRYPEGWRIMMLPMEGIITRSGADRYYIAYGTGPDMIESIICGNFNAYLYNEEAEILYEITWFMNFSTINIHYPERNRIFNYLLFQTLFAYIRG